jgi:hypothetical protein
VALDFLTAVEKTLITDDIADLVADAQVRVSITYKAFSSKGAFAPSTGKVAETYSDSSINAVRFPISEREVERAAGKYQVGDYRYMIKQADIATPTKNDRIVDGSNTRFLVSWISDPLGIFNSIVARNLG